MHFLPRDFIETRDGLFFAVVDRVIEEGRVLCFLRYACLGERTEKLDTLAANTLLQQKYPAYRFYSRRLDVYLHAVFPDDIKRHHTPRARIQQLLVPTSPDASRDAIERRLLKLMAYLASQGINPDNVGVTGSLLIGRQHAASDIDLVFYDRGSFFQARQAVVTGIERGILQALDEADWRAAWDRRGCELDFDAFVRHERRKGNKGMIDGVKFDLALVADEPVAADGGVWIKHGSRQIRARVTADAHAYDQPARYALDHAEISEILCFTHTYAGQAHVGETIAASGMLEVSQDGRRRLVVGSSREAPGEYIRVLWDE
jgi:uncharacterized protein